MAEKKTGMELFQDARPLEREFSIDMVATSTDEVGVEVDTDIRSGSKTAWAILGLRYAFELIAAPNTPFGPGATAAHLAWYLQLVRGALPTVPVCIGRQDHDLIGEDIVEYTISTAVGFNFSTWPREVPFLGVTQLPTLHLTFGTTADMAEISLTTYRLVGSIIYNLVTAPKARHEDL